MSEGEQASVSNEASSSGKGGCAAVVILMLIGWMTYSFITSRGGPMQLSPNQIVSSVPWLEELWHDEESGTYSTYYLENYPVLIKADSLDSKVEFVEMKLPSIDAGSEVAKAFAIAFVSKLNGGDMRSNDVREFIDKKWGGYYAIGRFGKALVILDREGVTTVRITGR